MGAVDDVHTPKLITEVGDVRRFHSAKALAAYAEIAHLSYESGQSAGINRKITERGSSVLRKAGYEVIF